REKARRRRAPGAGAVPRARGVRPVRLRSRSGDAQAARARRAHHGADEAAAVYADDGGADGGVAVRGERGLHRRRRDREGARVRGRAAELYEAKTRRSVGTHQPRSGVFEGHRTGFTHRAAGFQEGSYVLEVSATTDCFASLAMTVLCLSLRGAAFATKQSP